MGEIDAVDALEKAVHEMLPRLFALGDDVDAGVFLHFHREQRRVALGVDKFRALKFPGRPQHVGLGQPFGLRQRAGDRRWKQHGRASRYDYWLTLICHAGAMAYKLFALAGWNVIGAAARIGLGPSGHIHSLADMS